MRLVRTSILPGLGALLLLALPAGAYVIEKDFYSLSEQYVSPHTAWGKPYAGGRTKALFICPRGDAREVIEVAERLDLDYKVILTLSSEELGWTAKSGPYASADGASYDEMVREAALKLQGSYDVIITGQVKWDLFPRELLYSIMEKVHNGTGLVVGHSGYGRNKLVDRLFAKPEVAADYVTLGVPLAALPVLDKLDPKQAIQTRQFHDGRMVLLDYPGRPIFMFLTPLPPDSDETYRELHYEYYLSLVLKAILWAAKREPQVQFTELGVDGGTIDRGALAQHQLLARWRGVTRGMQAEVTIRDEDGSVFSRLVRELSGTELRLPLPVLPAGRYFADLIVHAGQNCVTWGTAAFTVTTSPAISAVTLDPPAAKAAQPVTATVALSAPAPAGFVLYLVVTDNLGREVLRRHQPVPAGSETVRAQLALTAPLAVSADVAAYLVRPEGGKQPPADGPALTRLCSAHAVKTLYVPLQRSRGNYAHAVWSAASQRNDFVRRLMLRRLHDCDVDLQTNAPTSLAGQAWLQQNNFDTIPYATRYSYSGDKPVRDPCLTDPKFLQPHLAGLEKLGQELGPLGPRAYTLGDECFLARGAVDVCSSPTCVADFQQWLQTEYRDVAALNASWGTSLKSFAEAQPLELAEAKKLGRLPQWVDHRRHMEFVYARMMQRAREAIRRGDPAAEVGFDGPFETSSFSGNDWSRLMDAFTMCNVYFHQPTQWEFLRSFARPDMLLGLWYGGYFEHRSEDEERLWPWRGILNGFNSMWWYAVYHGNGGVCPMDAVTPSLTIYPSFQQATEEMKELRAGSGQALMSATRLDDGIGVHYSQSSLHASTFSGDYGRLDSIWLQCFQTLEDLGLQYTCRAYGAIEREGIDPQRFPVFVLPCSQALSPAEAAAFRTYVAAGGLLLADVRPGLYDQHGKAQTPGVLDDLFGIKRNLAGTVDKNVAGTVSDPLLAGGQRFDLAGVDADGQVRVTDGKACGQADGVPLVILKQTGKGRAVLLNYGFGSAARVRREAGALAQWGVLKAVLALAGLKPRVTVEAGGDPLRLLEIVRFQDGPIQYLGFLKNRASTEEQTVNAKVTLAEGGHVYDVRAGRYLGQVSSWQEDFVPARARLYARLPYTIGGVLVAATKLPSPTPDSVGPSLQCSVTVQCSSKAQGRHWVELRVIGPDGRVRRHYGRNLPAVAGKAATTIPLALNDPPGTWKVLAREVISGKTGEAVLRL